jgi:hypothetical protein
MFALQNLGLATLVILASVSISTPAQTCAPPPGFTDTPHPAIATAEQLVSHTEEITIDRPLPVVLAALNKPIKDTIHKANSLPGVSGDYMLTKGTFGDPGSRRLDCLSDGSTLEEEVLDNNRDNNSSRFHYVVWNYTSEAARPIQYGVGDFHYSDIGGGRTHVVWTYSFMLNHQRFPGELGSLGQFLFRIVFLDRQYAEMMRGTLEGTKSDAERQPASTPKATQASR